MISLTPGVVSVFGKEGCIYCKKAMDLLGETVESPINYVDVGLQLDVVEHLKEISNGHSTFPFIFWGDQFVGGFREVSELIETSSIMGVSTVNTIKLKENEF